MKKLLLIALCSLNLCADVAKIANKAFFVPNELGKLDFYFEDDQFIAIRGDEAQIIPSYRIDKQIRGINSEQLEEFLHVGYISVSENEHHEISLQSHVRGLGGGLGGANAGFLIGKFLTYAIGYGVVNVVAAFSGPAFLGVVPAANLMAAPFIEGWSNSIGLGCGILGAILTGPV